MPKKFVVIGGAGFIGSHLVQALQAAGNSVLVIDKDIDILSARALELLKKEQPDAVFYLAGPMQLRKGAGPVELEAWKAKYAALANVFSACAHMKTKVVVASSGGAIYANPNTPYAAASIFLEGLVKQSGVSHAILRFSNVYGPGQWKDGVIPSIISNMRLHRPVVIAGSGNQTRDFLYIDDAVSALLKAGESFVEGTFDVGSGQETSINVLAEQIASILNFAYEKKYEGSGGADKSVVDPAEFSRACGWQPAHTLAEGLKKTIASHE